MKRISPCRHAVFALAVLLTFHNTAQAGTNDLFQSKVSWKCVATGSVGSVSSRSLNLQLTNPRLMNLALSNAMDAPPPSHYKLGLQCNCSNLDMNVVVYDKTTMETVMTLAAMRTIGYQSTGKIAWAFTDGRIIKNGLLLSGELSGQLVVRLDRAGCLKKATLCLAGTLEVETTNGPVAMNLDGATLHTSGNYDPSPPQVPAAMAAACRTPQMKAVSPLVAALFLLERRRRIRNLAI